MVICPTCKTENDEYAVICSNCKAYIQNRIPNLDFFETVWKVIESPRKAFHDITLSEHKNYSLLLFALFGVALSFTGFWYFRLGLRFDSLFTMLGEAIGIGIAIGFVCALLFTVMSEILTRILGGKGTLRNSLGVLAYATTPVSLSLVLILPVELAIFGMFLFTSNPSPYSIKPGLYVVLIAVDALMGLWAFGLGIIAVAVGKQLTVVKSVVAVAATTFISLVILYWAASYLVQFV